MGTVGILTVKSLIVTVYLLDVIFHCNNKIPDNLFM